MEPKIQKLLLSFFDKFEKKSFTKGKTVIKPRGSKIFFLASGIVRMSSPISKKGNLTLNIYRPCAILPMSLAFNMQNKYTFSSLTEVQGYFAPKKNFERFIRRNPIVSLDLLKRIYQGMDGFFILLEATLLGNAFYRILVQLIIYARRFGKKDNRAITFDWHITHSQLASQTGLARESVTKEIKKLRDKGLIGYSGKKLVIYNLPALEEEWLTYLRKLQRIPS